MCSKTLPTITFLLIAFSGVVVQSQDAPPAYKHLKPIESFLGVWKARFDPPGDVPDGDLEIHFRWKGDRSYIESIVYFHPDGASENVQLNPEFTVIGYDANSAAIKAWHFKYTHQGRTEAEIDTKRFVINQHQGQKGQANFRLQRKTYVLEDAETLALPPKL
ncbi:MAG: hypothetical protein SGI77_17265 [Pirellulaceae bacterium]|nr:hypothetical protein [Pirellulaceae bacterium]